MNGRGDGGEVRIADGGWRWRMEMEEKDGKVEALLH